MNNFHNSGAYASFFYARFDNPPPFPHPAVRKPASGSGLPEFVCASALWSCASLIFFGEIPNNTIYFYLKIVKFA